MLPIADLFQISLEPRKIYCSKYFQRKNNLKGGFFFKEIKLGYTCILVDKLRSLFCENWIEIKIYLYINIYCASNWSYPCSCITKSLFLVCAILICIWFAFVFYFKGIPEFDNLENLVDVLTNFIYICSVEHSATNFPQYDQYAFPPNFAATLHGHPSDVVVIHVF